MHAPEQNVELLLKSANRRLSELLHKDQLPLTTGGTQSLEDPLWVWGILGGKEVGKSTLINALAGADVVERDSAVGEGTFQPAAYLSAGDIRPLRSRFADLDGIRVTYHSDAPDTMRGLVLVDLPDFDSLFTDHVTQVRRIAGLLDGIIWVTTPKKVGDLRAATEIRRVLKDRTNFVYVVNKMDWLLAQANLPPQDELDRMSSALCTQVRECDPDCGSDRTFAISARYRTAQSVLDAIARSRNLSDVQALGDAHQSFTAAVAKVLGDFDDLQRTLTTTPTADAAAANKRANLAYQTRMQARQLLDHYQPRAVLDCLDRAADDELIRETVTQSLPHVYCTQLINNLNSEKLLFAEWSTSLFKKRIAYWPLLGIIAWPITLLGTLLGGLRWVLPGSPAATSADPFRFDGLSLEERTEAIIAAMRARLATVSRQINIELVGPEVLAQQFRNEAQAFSQEQRSTVITPFLQRKPTPIGRLIRWLFPFAVLLWFPLVQPILAGLLDVLNAGLDWNVQLASTLVGALSAGNVLMGLCVSLLILAATVAAIYSTAVRDSFAALELLRGTSPEIAAEPFTLSIARMIARPIEEIRSQLSETVAMLEGLATPRSGD